MKYPKTLHLPYSEIMSRDDKRLEDDSHFIGNRIVMTEKLDGTNVTMSSNDMHARSEDESGIISSRTKAIYANVKNNIGYVFHICGEDLGYTHSIRYESLNTSYYVFSIWNFRYCLDFDSTVAHCNNLGLNMVPVIYQGIYKSEEQIMEIFNDYSEEQDREIEGFVIRKPGMFHIDGFNHNVAKYVRKNHVTSDKMWYTRLRENGFKR